ncbi:fructose-bisphosphate aldolase, class II [Pseudoalteromonas sp. BSi20495]|nr:fructose-bisphosphate aldolase, class II [Pseudoalteromonas sp. BSi20495]
MNYLAPTILPGVIVGDEVSAVYEHARTNQYALPAVNVVSTTSINATLEAAKKKNSPVIIQLSNGGAQFFCGKKLILTRATISSAWGGKCCKICTFSGSTL